MSKIALNSNASGTGVFTIASPNSDTDRTLTLPDASGTVVSENASGNVAVTGDITSSGNAVITTQSPQLGRRNLIINGAMQVAQRGASFTGITTAGYSLDRIRHGINSAGTHTITQEADAPEGFYNSWKLECTTAASSLTSGAYLIADQLIEGQNLQQLAYGTANAKSVTLSFWVKASKTGTHIIELYNSDSTRQISTTYTINSANTWEYKSATINGDTVGSFNNDSGASLYVNLWLAAGSDFNSGTLNTSWASVTNANRVVGSPNYADTVGNTFQFTGFQLEVGDVATPFEHRSFGEELALCQRYFEKSFNYSVAPQNGVTNQIMYGQSGKVSFFVPKRVAPTITAYGSSITAGAQWAYYSGGVFTGANPTLYSSERMLTWFMGGYAYGDCYGNWTADAEL